MHQTHIKAQAEYWTNVPLIDRKYKACVHLENEEDELFWDTLLQKHNPGTYYYIYHSKSENGNDTKGCAQCMKYIGLLSKNFFICIDSDLRFLRDKKEVCPENYAYQTYTYSWENHYCFAEKLQQTLIHKCPEVAATFDFNEFLANYSAAIYKPFLLFLSMDRKGIKGFGQKAFSQWLPKQCRNIDRPNNGRSLTNKMRSDFALLFNARKTSSDFDLVSEQAYYAQFGLIEQNAYLHIRGHHLFDLINNIGRCLCARHTMDFEKDVLMDSVSTEGYWEIEKIGTDLLESL